MIRDVPKPVIAAVNGFATGGGHVLHLLCDLTIAADTTVFGQNGPRVGSFDAGFGTGLMARAIGEKRAREIWFRCRRYSPEQAGQWGLVNKVVPAGRLRDDVREWADEILKPSGIGRVAYSALTLFGESAEAQGGSRRSTRSAPDFSRHRTH